MDQLTPTDAIRFTRDFQDLGTRRGKAPWTARDASFRREARWRTRSSRPGVTSGGSAPRSRSRRSSAAVVHLGAIREGRKALIFVSEGVRGLGRDGGGVMADVVRAANESNTAIYSVDPRGLTARGASDSLFRPGRQHRRADHCEHQRARRGAAPGRAASRAPSTCSATRRSATRRTAGSTRSRSASDRPGLDVRARRGYWAPSARAVDDAKRAAAAARPARRGGRSHLPR